MVVEASSWISLATIALVTSTHSETLSSGSESGFLLLSLRILSNPLAQRACVLMAIPDRT